MPGDVIKRIERTVEKYRMLNPCDKVVVAVSGGQDSMALLAALRHLSKTYELSLCVAHVNHGLRGMRADEEEAFVRQIGEGMGLVCEFLKLDIRAICRGGKKSIEEAAREARLFFFEEVRRRQGAHKIALGHHRRDQSETVLMNLFRGSGAEGLKGMLPVRNDIYIRPLIGLSKDDIIRFLRSEGLSFMIDDSNADQRYLRNRIRHRLLPELKERYNPRLEENLCRTAEIMRLDDDYLRGAVRRICDDRRIVRTGPADPETRISIPDLLRLHEALRNRLIKHLLLKCAKAHRGIGYIHIQAVRDFMEAPRPSGSLHLPLNLEIMREYDLLVIRRSRRPARRHLPAGSGEGGPPDAVPQDAVVSGTGDIMVPGVIAIPESSLRLCFAFAESPAVHFDCPSTVFIDYDCIVPPLTVRFPRPGDKIRPLGMAGTKKLKNEFIDRKIPLQKRKRTPVLTDALSVLWIVGSVLSDRVKITGSTKKILKIEII
jgi:tRNA(Ile)-lysidine synthase